MELAGVLREILPCDTEKPYIFISYSAEDKELVWRDVLEFQRRGYNIWIDEKNLDKTEDSWRYDALPAIEDMDCELLVFYVSRHSLISEGCYLELEKTIEEQTQAIHFGPVKFIAIDVEEIGNIIDYSKTVYNELRSSSLPKEQKQKQAIVLDKFKKNFFNSNNEKVRIHPKDEENRKMDYYEEIVASFPDSTRVLPVVLPVYEEKSETAAVKPADAEAVLSDDPAETADILQDIQADESTEEPAPSPQPENITNPSHEEIVYRAMIIGNHSHRRSRKGFIKIRECSDRQIQNALKKFAVGADKEKMIGFLDSSISSSGKSGFLLTSERLYSDLLKDIGYSLDLWKIKKVAPKNDMLHTDIYFENDSCVHAFFSIYDDLIIPVLNTVIEIKAGRIPDFSESSMSYHVTKDLIKEAMAAANSVEESTSFLFPINLKDSQMKNAVNTYASSASINQIVCMMDTTIRKNGKSGFLITNDRLYYSDLTPGDYIELHNLKSVTLDNSHIIISYIDGYTRDVFFSIYAALIYAFLEKLVMPES